VEEIGRNSVMPSTIPRRIASGIVRSEESIVPSLPHGLHQSGAAN